MDIQQIVSDGLAVRDSGEWVKQKLHFIERYLLIASKAMRKKWQTRCYLDLFSGPGVCRIRETGELVLGSAMRALNLPHPFTHYFLCDLDAENVDALQTRVNCISAPVMVEVRQGDANEVASEVVARIRALTPKHDGGSALCIGVLDPEGFELRAETIRTLSRLPHIDLIIYYPQSGLARNVDLMASNPEDTRIDAFFGTRDWRNTIARSAAGIPHGQLLELYKRCVKNQGFRYLRERPGGDASPLMRQTASGAPLYRLLFASHAEIANDIWEKALQKDYYGQRPLPGMD